MASEHFIVCYFAAGNIQVPPGCNSEDLGKESPANLEATQFRRQIIHHIVRQPQEIHDIAPAELNILKDLALS